MEKKVADKYLELLLSSQTPLFDVALETTDRVLGATHTLNLFAGAVGSARIGHATQQVR